MSRPPRTAATETLSERNSKPTAVKAKADLTSSSWLDWARLIIWVGLILALAPRLASFLANSLEVIGWQWQVDYDEGLNLSAAWHLSQGHNIYANSVPERFIAAPYPFLYFSLNAILIKLFGVSLMGGRILSFAGSLAIGFLIAFNIQLIAHRLGFRKWDGIGAGIFAGLCWFCLPPPYIWSTFYKQDMVAIAIALAGLTLVYLWQDSKKLYWAAPVLALAFFAKQNELSAVGIGGLFVAGREILRFERTRWQPNWRRALTFGLLLAGLVLVPFGLLTLLTKGGYYNHIIGYQLVPWNFEDMARRVGRVLGDHPVLVVIAVLGFILLVIDALKTTIVLLSSKSKPSLANGYPLSTSLVSRHAIFPLYMLVATASLFTVGAYQGNYNLTLDLFPPLLILTGVALFRIIGRKAQAGEGEGKAELTHNLNVDPSLQTKSGFPKSLSSFLLPLSSFLVFVALIWQATNFDDPWTYTSHGPLPGAERRGLMLRLTNDIQQVYGDFVTEDVYLPLSQGRAVPYDNLYHMRLQAEEGKWDDSIFLQDLRDRRFGLVLLDHESRRWTKQGWQVLNENYELVFPEAIDLWRPRARPLVPQHSLNSCSLVLNTDRLQLDGFSLAPKASKPLQAGDGLTLTTYWKVSSPIQSNYNLFVHLIDSSGNLVAQRDASPDRLDLNVKPGEAPKVSAAPTSGWKADNAGLTVDQSLPLPPNLSPGIYTLLVGAYRPAAAGLENMQPECSTAAGAAIRLGEVKLEAKR